MSNFIESFSKKLEHPVRHERSPSVEGVAQAIQTTCVVNAITLRYLVYLGLLPSERQTMI